jgi:hypothetical protein
MGRQTLSANFIGKAQAPKVFHGTRLRGIGLRVECCAWLGVDQKAVDVSATQFVGEHQPKRSTTRNQNIGFNGVSHHFTTAIKLL